MTIKDKETIIRALGVIEGLSFATKAILGDAICTQIEIISDIIEKELTEGIRKE